MFTPIKPTSITPRGFLKRQLEIQANGLSGNLDKVWPDVRDSAWIGGNSEGWERVPYWLDGFIPLAYLLRDADKIARAKRYVTAILDRQKEDGWICPCDDDKRAEYDIWSFFLIGKVLAMYADFLEDGSEDKARVEDALYRSMHCLHRLLLETKEIKLFNWGKCRWFECLIPLLYLYEKKQEEWIRELARELRAQGYDYETFEKDWPRPLNLWRYNTHVVNMGMMFKYEPLCQALLGEEDKGTAERHWQLLSRYNGTVFGGLTGDECLSGLGANHGTELCYVTEAMYSCEVLYALTENPIWMERLEKLAFNGLPATISDDMWTHQYDQMVNQIACKRFAGKSYFRTNNNEANLFGLEPNFGCCTANFNQGWPKLAMHTFYRSESGLVCPLLLPAQCDTEISGIPLTVSIESDYPFRHSAKITVKTEQALEFELRIRIPAFAKNLRLNGEPIAAHDGVILQKQCWKGETTLLLEFCDTPHFVKRPFDLYAVEYGPLVFALPLQTEYRKLEYVRDGVERKFPYCDYELLPTSQWRYGFAENAPLTVIEQPLYRDGVPFSSLTPSLTVKTKLRRVHWEFTDGYEDIAATTPVSSLAIGPEEDLELIPYGCAKLRMTEMPITTDAET